MGKDRKTTSAPAKMTDRYPLRSKGDSYKAKLRGNTSLPLSTTPSRVSKSRHSPGTKKRPAFSISSTPLSGPKSSDSPDSSTVSSSTNLAISPFSSPLLSASPNVNMATPSADSGIDSSFMSATQSTPDYRNGSFVAISNFVSSSSRAAPQSIPISTSVSTGMEVDAVATPRKLRCLTCISKCDVDGGKMKPLPPADGTVRNRKERQSILNANHKELFFGIAPRLLDRLEYEAITREKQQLELEKRGRPLTPPPPPLVLTPTEMSAAMKEIQETHYKFAREIYNEALASGGFANIFSDRERSTIENHLDSFRMSPGLLMKIAKVRDREEQIKKYLREFFVRSMTDCFEDRHDMWHKPLQYTHPVSLKYMKRAVDKFYILISPDSKSMIFYLEERFYEGIYANELIKEEWAENGRSDKKHFFKICTPELPEYYISKALLWWGLSLDYNKWKELTTKTGRAMVNVYEPLKPDYMIDFVLHMARTKVVDENPGECWIEKLPPKYLEARKILEKAIATASAIKSDVKEVA